MGDVIGEMHAQLILLNETLGARVHCEGVLHSVTGALPKLAVTRAERIGYTNAIN